MSPRLSAYGVTVSPPAGFEGRVFRRPAHDEVSIASADGAPAPAAEVPNVVVHLATIALPADTGDFASGAVDRLTAHDVLIVLFEYESASAGQPLFARQGMPRTLTVGDFSPGVLQRTIAGQAGCQFFFSENGRPFCLYVVLGSFARRAELVPTVNAALASFVIEPLDANRSPATTMPPPVPTSTMPPLPSTVPTTVPTTGSPTTTTSPAPTSTTTR